MAGYTRQSETDIQATNVVKAKSLNDEYDQLLAAFHATSGHSHDGTAAEGGPITVMKDADGDTKIQVEESSDEDTIRFDIAGTEQLVLADGVLKPTTDNDIDLGTSSLEFKDAYFDGTVTTDVLAVGETTTLTGAVTFGNILSIPDGSASAPAITNTGDTNCGLYFSASDEIAFTAGGTGQVIFADGSVSGVTDNDIDLGSASYEFKDLYIDGIAHIDTLDIDENATVAGTLGVTGAVTLSNILSLPDGSASSPAITNTGDTNCGLYFSASDEIAFTAGGTGQVIFADGSIAPVTDNDIDLGSSSYEFKDGYFDGTLYTDAINLNGTAITSTAAEINILDGVTATATELNIMDGDTTATSTTVADADRVVLNDGGTMKQVAVTDLAAYFDDEITAMPNLTSVGTLTTLTVDNVIVNGTTIGHTDDTDLITLADGVATVAGEISVTTLDIGGTNVTSTAAELNILDGVTSTATELNYLDITTLGTSEASKAVTVDSSGDLIVPDSDKFKFGAGSDMQLYHDGSNSYITNATGALKLATETSGIAVTIGHGTSEVTIGDNLTVTGNLTVSGTQTVVDTVTMNAQNAVVFEGATADAHETTLSIVDPTADHTQYLINQGGYIPVLAAVTTTAITSTPAELNLLDGVTATTSELNILDGVTSTTAELNILDGVTSTAAELNIIDGDTTASTVTLADADRIVVNDNGTMKQVALTTLNTYIGGSTTTVGALNSGSITSGFGSIDNGSSAITTTGTVTFGSLSDGTITATAFVDEADMSSNSATLIPTQQSVKAYTDTVAGQANNVTGLTASGAELNVLDGASAGTIVNSKGVIYSSGGVVNATSLSIAGTALTATAAEFNLLDGGSTVGTTTVASGDGLLTNDGGTMRQTNIDTFDTYLSGTTKTLTNKTLTSPVLTTPTFADGGYIADANGAEMLVFQTTSSAANAVELTNSATGNAVVVGAMGSDSNVDINLTPKGTGKVNVTTSLAVDNITTDGNTISSTDTNGNINLSPNGTGKVYITNDSYLSTLIIESTIDGTQTAPDLDLYKNSASPADGDYIGNITWNAENSDGDKHLYFQMLARSMDVTAGTEDGAMEMWSHTNGGNYERFTINPTEVVVNESSIISDFRVESNGDANCLFVDGTNDRVGIGTSSPSQLLDVDGTANVTTLSIGGTSVTATAAEINSAATTGKAIAMAIVFG